ncbi:hypothetical protein [Streptomyces sp. NPDC003006]
MSGKVLEQVTRWAQRQQLTTPVQLLCRQAVTDALARLRQHLDARTSYAVKASTHPLTFQAVRDVVDEYNVTNLAHLHLHLHLRLLVQARVDPQRIAYVNAVIEEDTARATVEAGITRFAIDDEGGLHLLADRSSGLRSTLRLRPSRDGKSPRSVIRFGTTPQEIARLAGLATDLGADIEALSFFTGTQSADLTARAPYRRALEELAEVKAKLAAGRLEVPEVNIGGGFPIARRRFHQDYPDFFARVNEHLRAVPPDPVTVVCEPGLFPAEQPSATQPLDPIMDSFDASKRDAFIPRVEDGAMTLLPNTEAHSFRCTASCEGLRQPHVVPLPSELDQLTATNWFD